MPRILNSSARKRDRTLAPLLGALDAQLPPGVFVGAAQLSFEIGGVLAAISKMAEEFGIAWPPCKEGVGQIKYFLEIAVPRGKARRGVEHDDAITHVVEGHTQLGLPSAQLVQQPDILDRDHRLVSKGGSQFDLLFREGLRLLPDH